MHPNEFIQEKFRNILAVVIPTSLAHLVATMGGFINAFMLSYVNEIAFAAGILIASFQLAIVTVSFALLFSLSAIISRIVGENTQLDRVGSVFGAGCVVSLAISVPIMVVLFYVKPILLAFGQEEELAVICESYFRLFVWSIPASALLGVCTQFMLGVFRQNVVFVFSLSSLIFTTALSYILIFGKLGTPSMGIEGLAWASMVASWLGLSLLLMYIFGSRDYKIYRLTKLKLSTLKKSLSETFKLGLPISIQMGNELFSFMVTTIMVGWIGVVALEAQQVITRYMMLIVIPLFGIAQAGTVLVGRHYGSGNQDLVRSYGVLCIWLGVIYALFMLLIFAVIPQPLIAVFIHGESQDLSNLLPILLVLVAIGQIFDAVRNITTGALRGMQETKYPMLVSIVVIWPVGVPLAYVMGFTLGWGLIGITVAHNISMVISSAILLYYWKQKMTAGERLIAQAEAQ